MKKITSKEPIKFRVDGVTLLEITKAGIVVSDGAAQVAKERLGDNITVTDVDIESEAKKVAKEAEKAAKDAEKAEAKAKAEAEKAAKDADNK